jgi:hypothetical protein
VARLDPVLGRLIRAPRRDLRLGDEQLVLEAYEDLAGRAGRGRQGLLRYPEVGAQLVVRAERLEALGLLQYAGATRETGLAAVAGAGV